MQQAHKITLKGSTDTVVEFFDYSINSILFQRGIYPPEDFKMTKKYGLNMLITTDERLVTYLKKVMAQLHAWLMHGQITKLVLAIKSIETNETLERWQFDIHVMSRDDDQPPRLKSDKDVHQEIQAIIRQITASVTFLPMLEETCSFNILVYADKHAEVPLEWVDSDPHFIQKNAEQVRLRSFSTNVHKIDALVSYKLDQE
jgi:mitotic spindle assembly checkpoint protein MAD2